MNFRKFVKATGLVTMTARTIAPTDYSGGSTGDACADISCAPQEFSQDERHAWPVAFQIGSQPERLMEIFRCTAGFEDAIAYAA